MPHIPLSNDIVARLIQLEEEVELFYSGNDFPLSAAACLLFSARRGMDLSCLPAGDVQFLFKQIRNQFWSLMGKRDPEVTAAEIVGDMAVSMFFWKSDRGEYNEEEVAEAFGRYCFPDHDMTSFKSMAVAQALYARLLEIKDFANETCSQQALSTIQQLSQPSLK